MILYTESDAAYLVLPKAHSCVANIFYLSNATAGRPPLNGAIQVICKTLQNVVSSAAKAETGVIFVGSQKAFPFITNLSEINNQQQSSRTRMSEAFESFWRRLAVRTPFAVELSVDMRVFLAGCRWLSLYSVMMMGTAY